MNLTSPDISFVIPVYNEEAVLEMFRSRMSEVMSSIGCNCEVVMVNDGSRDSLFAIMDQIAAADRIIVLSICPVITVTKWPSPRALIMRAGMR